ncbi:MAG: ribosome biogenesis GTP-binding protein YihA/YsxC [Bacilli bacterium]
MIKTSQYVISAVSKDQYPNQYAFPEFVFLGRSNVGKSSLINALTNRKLLARISSTPGKTNTVNFYLINGDRYFVDVPGYGYAVRSLQKRFNYGGYIEEYLKTSQYLKIAFLLVDTKIGPTQDDILMYDYLSHLHVPIKVIGTKADKIGTTHLFKAKKVIETCLPRASILITSTVTKQGIDELLKYIIE